MEMFYKIALLFALVFLIICLIFIGIIMQYQNAGKKFPLRPTVCPDRWTTQDNGVTCNVDVAGYNKGKSGTPSSLVLSTVPNTCDKKKWTTITGVRWDGVSNYTGCA